MSTKDQEMSSLNPKLLLPKATSYTLGSLIGKGGLGSVYRAEKQGDFGFSKPVAIKFLNTELSDVSDETQTILHEAQIVSKLIHPNVIQIFEIGKDTRGLPFLVMELIEGLSLDKLLQMNRAPLEPAVAVSMTLEIARSLQYIHQDFLIDESIIHCDLSLQNILFHEQSLLCKLTDFGFAKKVRKKRAAALGDQIIGNPFYISPEHARGGPVTPASDIYSLGLILSDLLFANRDFDLELENISELARQGQSIDKDMFEELSPRLKNVLEKMTATKPSKRIQTAEEVIAALEAVALEIEDYPRIIHLKKKLLRNVKKNLSRGEEFQDTSSKTRVLKDKKKEVPKSLSEEASSTRVKPELDPAPTTQPIQKEPDFANIDAKTSITEILLKVFEVLKIRCFNQVGFLTERLKLISSRLLASTSLLCNKLVRIRKGGLSGAKTKSQKMVDSCKKLTLSTSALMRYKHYILGSCALFLFILAYALIPKASETDPLETASNEVVKTEEQKVEVTKKDNPAKTEKHIESVFTPVTTEPAQVEVANQPKEVAPVSLKVQLKPWGNKIEVKGPGNFRKSFKKASIELELKPGEYTVIGTHPKLGKKKRNIVLGDKKTETVQFRF